MRKIVSSLGGRSGWLVLAMAAALSPWGTTAAPQDAGKGRISQDAVKVLAKDDDDEQAIKAFREAYHLGPGQILKHVPPPRPEGIRDWWNKEYPNHGDRPDQFEAMTFRWSDPDRLRNWSATTADGFPLRSLLRYLKVDVYPAEIDGDLKLLDTVVTGDWVFRDGVSDERMVHALESIMQRTLRLRIAMTFRQVEREVIVARGRYRYSPLPGRADHQIEIYAKHIGDRRFGGGGGGTFPEFLKWVGEWIGRPIVNEVEAPPKVPISWHDNHRSPSNDEMRREDHDEALVLKNLQEQTGLTFTRERKPIRILFIERAK